MRFISTLSSNGLRHVTLGSLPPSAICLGEAEHNGKTGAVIQIDYCGFIFQTGSEYQSVDKRETMDAFVIAANAYHAEIMASIGGNAPPHHQDCNDCDWSRCDCANCEWGGAK
jgi:hypothetical protein